MCMSFQSESKIEKKMYNNTNIKMYKHMKGYFMINQIHSSETKLSHTDGLSSFSAGT